MTNPDQPSAQRLERLLGFLRSDPQNPNLLGDAFDAALQVGAFDVAETLAAQGCACQPEETAWLNRQGILALAQGRYPEAEKCFSQILDEGQGTPVTSYNLAYARFGLGQFEAAQSELAPFLQEFSEVTDLAWALWLRCAHRRVQLDEGLQAFRNAMPHRLMPADAWGVASLMALDAGSLEEAHLWAERALTANPSHLEALVTSGSLALGVQDLPRAQACFQRAISLHETDGRSWSGIAFTRLLAMDLPGAQDAFHRAVAFMPDHVGTWVGLGWCECLSQRLPAAAAAFQRALDLDRTFAESHGGLAVALAQQGQAEGARTEIEIALRLDARCLSARYAQSLLSGEAEDTAAFLGMSRRALAQHPVPGREGMTLADLVFHPRR